MQTFYHTPAAGFIKFMEMGDEITVYASDNPLKGEWRLLGIIGNIDGQAEMQPTPDATARLLGVIARYEAKAREDKQALNVCKATLEDWRKQAHNALYALEQAREEIAELQAQLEALGAQDAVVPPIITLAEATLDKVLEIREWSNRRDFEITTNNDNAIVINLVESSVMYRVDFMLSAEENAQALLQAWGWQ